MTELIPNLFIGTIEEIPVEISDDWRIVNVASTYHYRIHKWFKGQDYKKNHCYLLHQDHKTISVNWVDGPEVYFDYQGRGVEVVESMMDFIDRSFVHGKKVMIICNQAISRSPSIALLYVAKRGGFVKSTYEEAKGTFLKVYPSYQPSVGMEAFLKHHWEEIV